MGLFLKDVDWVCAYCTSMEACETLTHMPHFFFFFFNPSLLSSFLPHPLSLCSSFTASQNILFLSMAEFRADKGVESSGGNDIMGFSCQIGSKSSLWVRRRAKGGSRFLPDFCRGKWLRSVQTTSTTSYSLMALVLTHGAGSHSEESGNTLGVFQYFSVFSRLLKDW